MEIATVILCGAMAVFLGWTWYAHRLSSALLWWAAAYAFAAMATLLIFQDRGAHIPYGLVIDDVLHIASAFMLWFGFRAFNGQRVLVLPMLLVCVLYVAGVETVVNTMGLPRRAFIDAALIIVVGLSVLSISEVVVGKDGNISWRALATIILVGHCGMLALRITSDLHGPIPHPSHADYLLHAALVIEPAILPVLLGYTLLALAFERRNADTETIAERDALTGLLNRRGLKTWLESGRHAHPLSVVLFDLDHFKSINDTHGHAVGDGVLQEVAERILAEIRAGDAFARIGGEEFVVLLPATGEQGALSLAERMRAAITDTTLRVGDVSLNVTGSFGVYVTNTFSSALMDDAIATADKALYAAKRSGRNCVRLAPARSFAG